MKHLTRILLLTLVAALILPLAASASVPYATYTYSSQGEVLYSPDTYVPDTIVTTTYMGYEYALTDIRDLFVGPDEKVYLVDASASEVLVLDRYYKYQYSLSEFINEQGVPDSLSGPSGVFVNEDYIFVCDSDNNRIVMFNADGTFYKIVPKPISSYFEEGSVYKPVACVADDYGRIFVVSSTTYQGVIVLNTDGDFFGFIGASKVTVDTFELLWSRFQSAEERELLQENVSTEFNNITIDEDNFIYVTTSALDENAQQSAISSNDTSSTYAPVRKLNAAGIDVMARNGFFPPSGEVKVEDTEDGAAAATAESDITGPSTIVDVAIGPEGTWSIVDQKRSKVFTYDANGALLHVFGDKNGMQTGNINTVRAIEYQGENILLLDQSTNSFVVYRPTEYADLLMTALRHDNQRMYDATIGDWTEILKRNNNFDAAYIQIARSLYRQGKYEESMEYFKAAYETTNYSESFKEIRKEWANKYFWIIPIVIVAFCWLLGKFFGYAGKVNKRTALKIGRKSLKEELLYAFHVILHPFDGFWDLKHEKRGSVKSAFVILLITILAYFYNSVGQGYIFNPRPDADFNIMGAITAVGAPLLLWVIANWCLTTLFEGEGSMKDIFVACCYCLTPLPLILIPATVVSNFLIESEGSIVTLLTTLAYVWLVLLIFCAMMVTHDYSVGKNFLTCVASIAGMAFIMFIGLLFSSLMSKIVSFVTNIIEEVTYRM